MVGTGEGDVNSFQRVRDGLREAVSIATQAQSYYLKGRGYPSPREPLEALNVWV
jgi:hypothetical protein